MPLYELPWPTRGVGPLLSWNMRKRQSRIDAAPSIRIGLATAILTAILDRQKEREDKPQLYRPQEPPQGEAALFDGLPDWGLAPAEATRQPTAREHPDRVTNYRSR